MPIRLDRDNSSPMEDMEESEASSSFWQHRKSTSSNTTRPEQGTWAGAAASLGQGLGQGPGRIDGRPGSGSGLESASPDQSGIGFVRVCSTKGELLLECPHSQVCRRSDVILYNRGCNAAWHMAFVSSVRGPVVTLSS